MARVRWTRSAHRDLDASLDWLERNRGPAHADRTAEAVIEAVARAAAHPELHASVGTIHPVLAALPSEIRRVLTRGRPRYAVYYRHVPAADEIRVLALGGAQLPPTSRELRRRRSTDP